MYYIYIWKEWWESVLCCIIVNYGSGEKREAIGVGHEGRLMEGGYYKNMCLSTHGRQQIHVIMFMA